MDASVERYLREARCLLRGRLQQAYKDFDQEMTYAPVASHDPLFLFLAIVSARDLTLKGADVNSTYLYSRLNLSIIVEQPTNSTRALERLDLYCLLHMSVHSARQAGMVWG